MKRKVVAIKNEQQWLDSTDPIKMVKFIQQSTSPDRRRLRLLTCALARQLWRLVKSPEGKQAIELAENYGDKKITLSELIDAFSIAANLTEEMILSHITLPSPVTQ